MAIYPEGSQTINWAELVTAAEAMQEQHELSKCFCSWLILCVGGLRRGCIGLCLNVFIAMAHISSILFDMFILASCFLLKLISELNT